MTWPEAEPDDRARGEDEQIMKAGATDPSKKIDGPTHREDDPEETEDEEVKVNCIGGFSGAYNPDMSEEDSDDDDDACEAGEMESNTVTDESRYAQHLQEPFSMSNDCRCSKRVAPR